MRRTAKLARCAALAGLVMGMGTTTAPAAALPIGDSQESLLPGPATDLIDPIDDVICQIDCGATDPIDPIVDDVETTIGGAVGGGGSLPGGGGGGGGGGTTDPTPTTPPGGSPPAVTDPTFEGTGPTSNRQGQRNSNGSAAGGGAGAGSSGPADFTVRQAERKRGRGVVLTNAEPDLSEDADEGFGIGLGIANLRLNGSSLAGLIGLTLLGWGGWREIKRRRGHHDDGSAEPLAEVLSIGDLRSTDTGRSPGAV